MSFSTARSTVTAEADGDLRRQIALRLTVLARVLRLDFEKEVSDLGVTRSQWACIAVVARNPGTSQRMIAESLEISEASAGRLIERLAADGLIEKRPSERDRRAFAIHVSPKAQPLLEKLSDIARTSEQRIFAGFSESELATFRDSIDRIQANLSR